MPVAVKGTDQYVGHCRCGKELRLGDAALGERYDIVLAHPLPHCGYFEATAVAEIMRNLSAKA